MKNFVTLALSACLLAAGMVLHAQDRVVAVTNAEGQVARMEYEIGDTVSREYSRTTGVCYFRNRWCDPSIGRWISKDPIGLRGGMNLYEFCVSNPINYQDSSGHLAGKIVAKTVKGLYKVVSREAVNHAL